MISLWKGQTASNGSLPHPVSSVARARARSKLLLLLCALLAAFLLTHGASHTSYGRGFWEATNSTWSDWRFSDSRPIWRPDLEFDQDGNIKELPPPLNNDGIHAYAPHNTPPLPAANPNAPKGGAPVDQYANLPLREPTEPLWKHDFPSALDPDPWPDRADIVKELLRADLESLAPPAPFWPADQDIHSKPLDKKYQVAFEKLLVPKTYKKPPLPGKRKTLPKVQFDFAKAAKETEEHRLQRERRREWVRTAMIHAWNGYKRFAWGHDEVLPVAKKPLDAFNGWGASIIDALDTLLIMNMTQDYDYARTHVQAVDFTLLSGSSSAYGGADGVTIPTFETTIRYLGGLLGAYDVSGDVLMLEKARELGDWMIGAFNTQTGIPIGRYKLGSDPMGGATGRVVLSEAGSMSLEYTRLWQITGEAAYYEVVQRATDFFDTGFDSPNRIGRLLPATLLPETPATIVGTHSFSSQCDSYYEYLIKEHQLLGGATDQYSRMYTEAMESAYTYLIQDIDIVPGEELLTVGDYVYGSFMPKLDHLTCFAGAMMGIGSKLLNRPMDLDTAKKFSYTCFWAYNVTATGVGPESIQFFKDTDVDKYQVTFAKEGRFKELRGDPIGTRPSFEMGYKGRPETIESVFYMYRITGDAVWQDRAWQMFVNWVRHTITSAGFAGLHHVGTAFPMQKDTQESYVFAETFKYYFLIFCDVDFMSLDDWVFNTEAHPLRLRPEEKLSYPIHDWSAPNEAVAKIYLEPAHATTRGRGSSIQRMHRAQLAKMAAAASPEKPAVPMPIAQAFNGGRGHPS